MVGSSTASRMKALGMSSLNGTQVDVRQRGLGHGGNDASHAGKIVGQGLVDSTLAGVGTVVRVQVPQPAVPFRLVQCEKVGLAIDIILEHEVNSGCPVQRQVVLDILKFGSWKYTRPGLSSSRGMLAAIIA